MGPSLVLRSGYTCLPNKGEGGGREGAKLGYPSGERDTVGPSLFLVLRSGYTCLPNIREGGGRGGRKGGKPIP